MRISVRVRRGRVQRVHVVQRPRRPIMVLHEDARRKRPRRRGTGELTSFIATIF